MVQIDLNNPLEIQNAGLNALQDALGPVGTVKFIQLYRSGHGDYTKERQMEPDVSPDEGITMLKEFNAKKQGH